jgi:RNA polymerase sigma-70 factor (ECF subfamily)
MLNFRTDATAFRAFINEHQSRLFNLILNRVQHVEDAEEITQDVFVDVYRKPESFRGDAAVSTWLYRIAINKCIDHLRKKVKRNSWSIAKFFNQDNEKNEPLDFYHPGIAAENKEKAAILFKAIKQLPEKQHTAWTLSELDNLSYKEISEIMDTTIPSVESLLFRARQNLKKIISKMYPEMNK